MDSANARYRAAERLFRMGVAQGYTGSKPAQPKPPTELEKELDATPPHPAAYGLMRSELGDARTDELIRAAAQKHFTYLLLLGVDKTKLETDPYWKYMEE